MKTLIVVDMQYDFVTGVLGNKEAVSIIPAIAEKIKEYQSNKDEIIFTQDTHYENYLNTSEGKALPVKHCIANTTGWKVIEELDVPAAEHLIKESFGYPHWKIKRYDKMSIMREFDEIEIVGVCTDICVVSNALVLKAMFPEVKITVDASCCAGTSIEAHKAAIQVMKSCQINIIGE